MMYELILKDYNEYDEESFFYESEIEYDSEEFFNIILEAIHTVSEMMESNGKSIMGKPYNIYNIVTSEEFSEKLKKYNIHSINFKTCELSNSFDSVEKVLKKYKYSEKQTTYGWRKYIT